MYWRLLALPFQLLFNSFHGDIDDSILRVKCNFPKSTEIEFVRPPSKFASGTDVVRNTYIVIVTPNGTRQIVVHS